MLRKEAAAVASKPFCPSSAVYFQWPSLVRLMAVNSTCPVWRVMVVPSLVWYCSVIGVMRHSSPRTRGGDPEMQVTEALLRAILELIEKCETLEELRTSVKRIMGE